jgi:hypothetical protein
MQITRSHSLTKKEALTRMRSLVAALQRKHGLRVSWEDDRAHIEGTVSIVSFSATLVVTGDQVRLDASDPGWLVRDRVKRYLGDRIEESLGR